MTLSGIGSGALRLAAVVLAGAALVASGPLAAQNNDTCASPKVIPATGPFPYTVSTNTIGYGDDSGDPSFACKGGKQGPIGKTAWFTFTPSVTDNYKIDTAGTTSVNPSSPYDTIMAVYTGTCANLVPLSNGCDDDVPGSLLASVSLALQAGTTYTFVIGGIGEIDYLTGATKPTLGGTLVVTVSHVAINYPYRYVIPSVTHLGLYVSDVNVTNLEGADGQFLVQFLGHGSDGDQNPPASQPTVANPIPIAAFGSRELADVLGSASTFNLSNDYGLLLFQSTRQLALGARTYTPAAGGGTYGQFATGLDASTALLSPGQSGRIVAVRDDNSTSTGFRTNVALFNVSAKQCPLTVEAHDGNGALLGSATATVPPTAMIQKSFRQFFPNAPVVRGVAVRVAVPTTSTGCSIGAIGYVIDNLTQDPFAVPLQN